MKKIFAIVAATLAAILFSGSVPSSPYNSILEREIQKLTERGLRVQLLGEIVEATDPVSGQSWQFSTKGLVQRQPTQLNFPMLTIDMNAIDTNQYNSKYHYLSTIPITGGWGYALRSGDVNDDLSAEVYGINLRSNEPTSNTRIYMSINNSSWESVYTYPKPIGAVGLITEVKKSGFHEILANYGDTLYAFEQTNGDGYPVHSKFAYRQWYYDATGIPNALYDIDIDGNPELLFRGSERDTSRPPPGNFNKTYVARYDSVINNLTTVWGRQLPPGCVGNDCTGNIAPGDFDGDGKGEFVTSSFAGNVYVVEYVQADSFEVVWQDSLSVAGRVAAGDVDGNGIEEFFVGGNQPEDDGQIHLRGYAFERTSDNIYRPVFEFNIFPVGFFFVDLYQTVDMDGDGRKELLISYGGGVVIIKGTAPHNYELFFYKQVSSLHSVSGGDVTRDGIPELFISRFYDDGTGLYTHTEVYEMDSLLVNLNDLSTNLPQTARLFGNYPNPFNSSTTLSYTIPVAERVTLKVFDLLGREVATLVDGPVEAGNHSVTLDASHLSSGIYFYRLTSGKFTDVKKLVLMK